MNSEPTTKYREVQAITGFYNVSSRSTCQLKGRKNLFSLDSSSACANSMANTVSCALKVCSIWDLLLIYAHTVRINREAFKSISNEQSALLDLQK